MFPIFFFFHVIKMWWVFRISSFFLQLRWSLHPICFLPESLRGIQISDLNIGSLEVCTAAESLHDETFDAASTSHNFLTRGKLSVLTTFHINATKNRLFWMMWQLSLSTALVYIACSKLIIILLCVCASASAPTLRKIAAHKQTPSSKRANEKLKKKSWHLTIWLQLTINFLK